MDEFHPNDARGQLLANVQKLKGLVDELAEKKRNAPDQPTRAQLAEAIDAVQDRLDRAEAQGQKAGLATPSASAIEGRGPLLSLEQKAAPHLKDTPDGDMDVGELDAKNIRLGALIVGALHYEKVKSQLTPDERKALGILTDPSGGMLLPTSIGRLWIDAVRPKCQVLRAGALTYAMEAHNVLLPGWDVPPQASWRGPTGTFNDAGGSFRNVQLDAKDCGCFLDIPQVLFEDAATNLEAVSALVEAQLAKAVAQAIDLAALLSKDVVTTDGSNATAIPQGLAKLDSQSQLTANYGINKSNVTGTNGASPTWDNVIDGVAAVAAANFTATGQLSAPRLFASLAKQKDSQLRYLARPGYLSGVTDYDTSQIPVNLKKGSSTDCTASFIGDFSQMVVGMRGELRLLVDPYTQALGRTTRLVIWQKADVGVLNKTAFQIIDGVRP
jgi:HK97 family phage major capsid protein